MTPDQTMLVQASFDHIARDADAFARLFYDRLFDRDPALRRLFRHDPQAQRTKLIQALSGAVRGLDDLDAMRPGLAALGSRHADYGVVAADYATVGRALVDALRITLGARFTAPVEQAWKAVFVALGGAMLAGVQRTRVLAA